MSAFRALDAARAAGVEVRLDGKDLVLSGASEPPADVLDMLSRHKAAIVEHLQAVPAGSPTPPARPRGWSAADWRVFHNDRQLVAEIALGKTRGQARAYAYVCCIREWCRVRPGSTEDQAITALVEKGIVDPSSPPTPPPPASAARWSAEDWLAYFDERAAIAEHDGKLDRPQAEGRAYQACLAEWLDQHPVSSKVDDGCVICGATDRPNDSLLPVGLGSGLGRTWLHRDCVPAWRAARLAEAARVLASMGIAGPAGSSS